MFQNDQEMINSNPIHEGKPYFLGDFALIRFAGGEGGFGPEVYWLVNKEDHSIRPFESYMALDTVFGDKLEDALKRVVVIESPTLDSNNDIIDGVLTDFSVLGPEYMIKEDGTTEPLEFSSYQLKGRYGKPIDENQELLAERAVDGLLNSLEKGDSKITPGFINKLRRDNQLMAFYIASIAYGGYSKDFVHADILRRFNKSKK